MIELHSAPAFHWTSRSTGEDARALGETQVDIDRRMVIRMPQQPLVRVDLNDYSIDPTFAGPRRRRVRCSPLREKAQRCPATTPTGVITIA